MDVVERVKHAIRSRCYATSGGDVEGIDDAAEAAIAALFDWMAERKLDGVRDPYWASEYWQGQVAAMRKEALGGATPPASPE